MIGIVTAQQGSGPPSGWIAWGPGLAGVVLGFALSEAVALLKRRNDRAREHRRFLADQANRLMEDTVTVFFCARNELRYLASELTQADTAIGRAEKSVSQFSYTTGIIPGAEELGQLRAQRQRYLDEAYANLKKYHAQGEPSVRLLCTLPLKIDLGFLNEFLTKVTEPYEWSTAGVINQCHLYESLHEDIIAARKRVLEEVLVSIRS